MSFVMAVPEVLGTAATDLTSLGSTLSAANAAAAAQTTGVLAAAEDEVSAAIAAVFSAHGQGFQALSAQAAAFHDAVCAGVDRGCGILCQRGGRQCCGVYGQSGADDRSRICSARSMRPSWR